MFSDGQESDSDYAPDDSYVSSPSRRKRKASLDGAVLRPKKRATGPILPAYLDLLNEDILHAASQCVPHDLHQHDERVSLPKSQIGMTVWSTMEKERFFEALARLGRDDVPGIALRIRTKGEMEVRQYMKLLQDSIAQRHQLDELPPLSLADFPAAVEISHECCEALEEMADYLAARQDHFETTVEQEKHGTRWLVSQETCKEMAEEGEDDAEEEAEEGGEKEANPWETSNIFNVPKWLMLSERFFMNAPSEDGNWQTVDGGTPSVRLSTLDDFRSLALTLSRRLVAASLYTANSRVRAERRYRLHIENFVRDKDVHAAAVSLGLPTRKPPLLKSIRKLGLHVYGEQDPPKPGEDTERTPLSHEAVEDALADLGGPPQPSVSRVRRQMERIALSSDESSSWSDSPAQGASSSSDTEAGPPGDDKSDEAVKREPEEEEEAEEDPDVVAEANEAILYCALDPPQTKRDRQALFRRIKAEREQEAHAEAVDAQASYQEERLLWDVLGRRPPASLADPGTPGNLRRLSAKQSVGAGYLVGKDWRAKTRMVSEWETQYRSNQ